MQQAICRAIEVDTSTDTLTVQVAGGAVRTLTPSHSLYANILSLLQDLATQEIWGEFTIGINSSYKVVITAVAGDVAVAVGGTLGAVAGTANTILGFTGEESVSAGVFTAAYTPQGMWLPTYITSDTNRWTEAPGETFRGSMGADGNLSGVSYTARRKRTLTWPWEFNYNAIEYADDASDSDEKGYIARAQRSFTRVITDARQTALAYSGSGNLHCKGVYFIHDLDAFQGVTANNWPASTSWTSGNLITDTTSDDWLGFIFCSAGPPTITGASDDTQRAYYDLSLELTSAVAPSWA